MGRKGNRQRAMMSTKNVQSLPFHFFLLLPLLLLSLSFAACPKKTTRKPSVDPDSEKRDASRKKPPDTNSGTTKTTKNSKKKPTPTKSPQTPGRKPPLSRVYKGNRVTECLRRAQAANPSISGKLLVEFVIGADGRVVSAKVKQSDLNNPRLESCVLTVIKMKRYPKPEGGKIVVVRYPFHFYSLKRNP
jgi:TonB family protein